jgi:DNA primase
VIGQETIDRVRQQTGIAALIGESVKLTKRGRSHVGLCPFHKEKTPSFHVNEERGFYHCFGCGASGDAIKFIQETQGLSFIEAVRDLAERAGIEIVETANDAERKQHAEARRRQQELYDASNIAAAFFERMLSEHPLRHRAQAELERRGLKDDAPTGAIADALQAFRIGYAPYSWDALAEHLRQSGVSPRTAESVGLLAPRKSGGGHYDRFRHRLMFAVLDLQGRVIGFSGRALEEPSAEELAQAGVASLGTPSSDGVAKYVNSPESPIYKKREAVFGLYQARQAVRTGEQCVVVEGNFDVVSLHARGVGHVVAPLGTAFTLEQARQVKRFCPTVILLFDGDSAGRRAVRAARGPCEEAGLAARVAVLPDGVDPDDLARRDGPRAVERVLGAARGIDEYVIDAVLEGFSGENARGQAAKIREARGFTESIKDPTGRDLAVRYAETRLAQFLGVSERRTMLSLERAFAHEPAANAAEKRAEPPHRARSRDRRDEIGHEILGALLDYPPLLDAQEVEDGIERVEGDVAAAVAALRQAWDGQALQDVEQLLAKLAPSIHPFAAARLAAPRHDTLEDARTELLENVEKLKRLEFERQKAEVVEELHRAQSTGDSDREFALLSEHWRRARERRGLTER